MKKMTAVELFKMQTTDITNFYAVGKLNTLHYLLVSIALLLASIALHAIIPPDSKVDGSEVVSSVADTNRVEG